MLEPAACVLIPTGGTTEQILAISRRNDFTKWGIPGGKQEPGESNLECAAREIYEECRVWVDPTRLHPIYSGACYGKDGRNFWVTTYFDPDPYLSDIVSEEGFRVKCMDIDVLCDPEYSPFFEYNTKVRDAWRAFYG